MRPPLDFALGEATTDVEGVTLLEASGDIDMTASREFGRRLETAVRKARGDVVLDLLQVVHLDSTALRHLLFCRRVAENRRIRLVLVCARPPVKQVLEVTGVSRLFDIHPDRAGALEAIGR